jgi:hypothetical protein
MLTTLEMTLIFNTCIYSYTMYKNVNAILHSKEEINQVTFMNMNVV